MGTRVAKGDESGLVVDWDKDSGDGVYCRDWWIRAVCAAAREANRLTRGLGPGAESAVDGREFVFASRLCSFDCVSGAIAESKPEKERERGRTAPAFGTNPGRGITSVVAPAT